jgi:hypothetical protein
VKAATLHRSDFVQQNAANTKTNTCNNHEVREALSGFKCRFFLILANKTLVFYTTVETYFQDLFLTLGFDYKRERHHLIRDRMGVGHIPCARSPCSSSSCNIFILAFLFLCKSLTFMLLISRF